MARRRSLLASAPARQPPFWLGILGLGVVVGVFLGSQLMRGSGDGRDDAYLVMASTLFSQGESAPVLRERLIGIGFAQPMVRVAQLGDAYAQSPDRLKARQSDALIQFAKALGDVPTVPISARAPVPAANLEGNPTPAAAAAATPSGLVTGPAATPTLTLDAVVGRSSGTPAPSALLPTRGKISPPGGGGVQLREQPTTASKSLQVVANGATIEILETVQGQAVEPSESRWYRVKYGDLNGFIYYKLVAIGE